MVWAGLGLLFAVCAAAQPSADAATAAFERGVSLVKAGKFEAAIKEFDETIRLKPGNAQAYNDRGVAYEKLQQPARAYADYDQAVALDPNFLEALNNRGRAGKNTGRPKSAIEDFNHIIDAKPDFESAYVGRGDAYRLLGQADRAIEDFDRAIKLKPHDPEAFRFRAIARHDLGKDEASLEDSRQALKLKPDFAEALVDRGATYDDMGRSERAIEDYDQAIKLEPDLSSAFFNRGNSYRKLGKPADAIASYDQAIKLSSGYSAAFNNRGIVYRGLGQTARAFADFDIAFRLDSANYHALENRAALLKDLGRTSAAIADYSRAHDIYNEALQDIPGDQNLLERRALAAYNAERWKDAVSDYSAVIAIKDSAHLDDAVMAELYLKRGGAYDAGGDNERGLADVEIALSLNRRIDQGQFWRASLLRAVGKYEQALDDYDELARDDDPVVYFNRAVTYFCLGRFREAENDIRRYLKTYKDEISAYAWIHILRVKREMTDDPKYAELKSPYSATDWITQIADLYRGRLTVEKVEATMMAARQDLQLKSSDTWPCSVMFYLGEYKLEHGDLAGAKADLGSITPANCNYAEADVAAAELTRLPAN